MEEIDISKIKYRLIKLLQYESDLKKFLKLEPQFTRGNTGKYHGGS